MNQVILPNARKNYPDSYFEIWRYRSNNNRVTYQPVFYCESQLIAIILLELLQQANPKDVYNIEVTNEVQSEPLHSSKHLIEQNTAFKLYSNDIRTLLNQLKDLI